MIDTDKKKSSRVCIMVLYYSCTLTSSNRVTQQLKSRNLTAAIATVASVMDASLAMTLPVLNAAMAIFSSAVGTTMAMALSVVDTSLATA